MKIHVLGLGRFGMFLVGLLLQAGHKISGWDINKNKKSQLIELGGKWVSRPKTADVVVLSVFPRQITPSLVRSLPYEALLVNISSVQEPGIQALRECNIKGNKILSLHPLFGPVGIASSGWSGKQIIVTHKANDDRASKLLEVFSDKGVVFDEMTPTEHDTKMVPHALAFLCSELIRVGMQGADPRYLTGSAHHMLGLLDFTEGSQDLRNLILSNPALRELWTQRLKNTIATLTEEFGWEG